MTILTPTTLPAIFGKVYRTRVAAGSGYMIFIGGKRCDGGTVCTMVTVEGESDIVTRPRASRIIHLTLPRVASAWYETSPCGANCAGSFRLTFVRDRATYVVSIKASSLAEGRLVANGLRRVTSASLEAETRNRSKTTTKLIENGARWRPCLRPTPTLDTRTS